MADINNENKTRERILVSVLAHPDDETFGMGGTLAKYAHEGVTVYLICATRGEVGEMDKKYLEGFESTSQRREFELRCASKKLGIKEVFFLNYLDSGMAGSEHNRDPQSLWATPVMEVAAKVYDLLKQLKPQVVLTFDPIGGYRHPDHIRIHEATVKAFMNLLPENNQSPDLTYQPQKLYYHTIPKTLIKISVFLMRLVGRDPRKFGANKDIDLQAIVEVDFPIHAIVKYAKYAQLVAEASACHASQGGSKLGGGILGWLRKLFSSKVLYMRAYPEPLAGEKKESDLFTGVR